MAGGGVPGCSLPSAVVLLVYMPARREYKRVGHFFCYISRFVFQELGGGRRGAGGFLPLAAAIPVCIIAGRVASVQELFFFCASAVKCLRTGWVGGGGGGGYVGDSLSQRWRFWHACQRIGRAMRGNIFPFALSPFSFNELGGVEIEGPVSFYSPATAFLLSVGSESVLDFLFRYFGR